jgi:hypothetical protein
MPGDDSLGAASYSFASDRFNLVMSHSNYANIKKAYSLFFRQGDGPSHSTSAATTQGLTPCLRSITRSLILPQITVPLV